MGERSEPTDGPIDLPRDGERDSERQVDTATYVAAQFYGAVTLPLHISFAQAAAIEDQANRLQKLESSDTFTIAGGLGGPIAPTSKEDRQRHEDEEYREYLIAIGEEQDERRERTREQWSRTTSTVAGVSMTGAEWSALAERLRNDEDLHRRLIEAFEKRGMAATFLLVEDHDARLRLVGLRRFEDLRRKFAQTGVPCRESREQFVQTLPVRARQTLKSMSFGVARRVKRLAHGEQFGLWPLPDQFVARCVIGRAGDAYIGLGDAAHAEPGQAALGTKCRASRQDRPGGDLGRRIACLRFVANLSCLSRTMTNRKPHEGGMAEGTGRRDATTRPRLLLVEDDSRRGERLEASLRAVDFDVLVLRSAEIFERLPVGAIDLILLERDLIARSAFQICEWVRAHDRINDLPIILYTGRDEEAFSTAGLIAGADDCLGAPVSHRELAFRANALIRRRRPDDPAIPLVRGDLELDEARHRVRRSGTVVEVSSSEFRLLRLLMLRSGEAVSREELLEGLDGRRRRSRLRLIDAHVARLRQALRQVGGTDPISTIRSVGYMLANPVSLAGRAADAVGACVAV